MTKFSILGELCLETHKVGNEQQQLANRDKEWTSKSRLEA